MASPSDQPRALITGLGGFTGRYVAAELEAAGYHVFGTTHGTDARGLDMFAVDLCDRPKVHKLVNEARPQLVAHLAAISFVQHGDAEAIYRVNVMGTRNLLEALAGLDDRPQAVLLASSANVYGNSGVEMIDESVSPAPANDYAVSKLAMEYMARLWMDRLPITIARPFNYTGVGQAPHFLLPKIVSHFQRREKMIELGNIDIERDFSDVRMVAAIYRMLLEKSPAGEVFNVCSGVAVSLKQVLAMMAEIAGYEIEVKIDSNLVRTNDIKRLQGIPTKLQSISKNYQRFNLIETLSWMYSQMPKP